MFGSQGIMFTADAAMELLQGMKISTPTHFDLWLLDWLERAKQESSASWPNCKKACYVAPPVGNFAPHYSRNTGTIREGLWQEAWCVGGSVRDKMPNNRPRRLLAFAKKGEGPHIADCDAPKTPFALHWQTQLPPDSWENRDPKWLSVLAHASLLKQR